MAEVENEGFTSWRSGKGKQLCAHTTPFLTAKQPEQLAAPLEPGEGGKELIRERCRREEEERKSDTEELGGSCCTASRCAVMWSVSALHAVDAEAVFRRELMNCGWTILHFPQT